jgi:hypothetical protein
MAITKIVKVSKDLPLFERMMLNFHLKIFAWAGLKIFPHIQIKYGKTGQLNWIKFYTRRGKLPPQPK